ncbi:MAG: DEAD/DEAH box helicase [Anaerolineae bacterium]|jgi:ATP-dependent RNA helicase DeaD|nr:DEAD/DEAH box helicase [Anaerolineae bacterium]
MTTTFETLGLRAELLQAITESGYTEPTAIQQLAIPVLLGGHDVLGQAQTGTGKTAAFGLPLLHQMDIPAPHIQALILTPTRELALQVSDALWTYGKHRQVRIMPIYGGQSYVRQQKRLERGVDVVVGTPGRLLDLMHKKMLDLSHVRYLVLDEADEMLRMGFIEDVEAILSQLAPSRQTALFSATLPEAIRHIAGKYMRQPEFVHVPRSEVTVQQIEQYYVLVHNDSRIPALSRMLEMEDMQSALVFTRTRAGATELMEALQTRGYLVDVISGDLSQEAREAVMRRFRSGDLPVLVATDVVARGVDIPDVSHVFNFDIPMDEDDYVHRIGRTGRAGRSGKAITLVAPEERRRLRSLEHFIKQPLTEMKLPRLEDIRTRRNQLFLQQLEKILETDDVATGMEIVATLTDAGYDMTQVAAAAIQIARLSESKRPVDHVRQLDLDPRRERPSWENRRSGSSSRDRDRDQRPRREDEGGERPRRRREATPEEGMVRLMMNIGHTDGIRPGDIVGSIAAHAGIPGKAIGAIEIRQDETYVDVQEMHVERVLNRLKRFSMKHKPVKLVRA